MRDRRLQPRLAPAVVVLAVIAAAAGLFAMSPATRALIATTGCPAATPGSSPCPANAFLNIDPAGGGPNTPVNVHGRQFLPNEVINLYWDSPGKVAGTATANASGSFDQTFMPFPGDAPGNHAICTTEPPSPCATFNLQAAATSPTPTSSPSNSPTPSASASPSPTESPSPSPVAAASINGIDIITRPPFVFLPIIALLALIGLAAYWALGGNQRSRTLTLPAASVVHRAARPDHQKTQEEPAPPPLVDTSPSTGLGPEPPIREAEPPMPTHVEPPITMDPEPPAPMPPPAEPPPSMPPEPPPVESQDWPSTFHTPSGELPPSPEAPAAPEGPPDLPEPGD
jgi:hypothetical protein